MTDDPKPFTAAEARGFADSIDYDYQPYSPDEPDQAALCASGLCRSGFIMPSGGRTWRCPHCGAETGYLDCVARWADGRVEVVEGAWVTACEVSHQHLLTLRDFDRSREVSRE